jgi:hypothetical protein
MAQGRAVAGLNVSNTAPSGRIAPGSVDQHPEAFHHRENLSEVRVPANVSILRAADRECHKRRGGNVGHFDPSYGAPGTTTALAPRMRLARAGSSGRADIDSPVMTSVGTAIVTQFRAVVASWRTGDR